MTNFEKIKGMRNEKELANFLCETMGELKPDPDDYECNICPWERICENGKKGTLKWLEAEVGDANSD